MGIYSENVTRYADYGLYLIPCGDRKNPVQEGWQKYCTTKPTDKEIELWESKYIDYERMGLLLGPSTGIVAFDFDYEYNSKVTISEKDFKIDMKNIEKEILRILPPSPCEKVGRKGWTKFYRYNPSLKNVSVDRNHVRLFDFMAINKQTLIPPSLHSPDPETNKFISYKWTATPITDCLDDLPEITQAVIDEMRYIFSDSKTTELGGRHGNLFKWIMSTSEFETDMNRLYRKLVDHDIKIHSSGKDRPYLSDPKYFRNPDALINAKNFIDRVLKWKSANKNYTKKFDDVRAKSKTSYEAFEYFFEEELKDAVREKLTGEFQMRDFSKKWIPVVNNLKVLKSKALSFNLNESKTEIHLASYEQNLPLRLLIEPKPWDGDERLLKIFSHIRFDEEKGLDAEVCWELFKEWCANVFRRVENPLNQNKILIFRGDQDIGKDRFVNTVIGAPFESYFIELCVRDRNEENFQAVYGKMIANIAEFDATNKMNISALKTLITSPKQTIRLPYAHRAQEYSFHCSFFSSSNFSSILRDTSGNRRFCIFDVAEINFDYSKLINEEQILAEMHQWYKDNYRASKESHAELKKLIAKETPESPDDIIFELAYLGIKEAEVELKRKNFGGDECRVQYHHISEYISKIARELGVTPYRVQQVIKGKGLQKRNMKMRYYTTEDVGSH